MSERQPSESELEALEILWDLGEATVSDLHEIVCRATSVGYTTILKRLQRMEQKGLVARVPKQSRQITYRPIAKPESARENILKRMIRNVFGNSTNALVQQAIGTGDLSAEDIAGIRQLLDEIERSED